MTVEEKIRAGVEQNLQFSRLEIINESHKHVGHSGDDGSGQTHFKLIVVSDEFKGLTRIERQRLVNSLIAEAFKEGLHAISMDLKTLAEIAT